MGHETNFADLTEGSIAYSASRAGALDDAAYWRGVADMRQDQLAAAETEHDQQLADRDRQIKVACATLTEQWLEVRRLREQLAALQAAHIAG